MSLLNTYSLCLCRAGGRNLCPTHGPIIVERRGDVTFRAFAEATNQRTAIDFGEALDATSKYGPEHWALMIQEEAGEVAGALIGALGMKKRKNHLTFADVGKEIADVVAYCACLVIRVGGDFERIGDSLLTTERTFAEFADELAPLAIRREAVTWALKLQEGAGAVAVVLGSGLYNAREVRVEVGKVIVACACLAFCLHLDFQEIVRSKFNEVSDRIGSSVKL